MPPKHILVIGGGGNLGSLLIQHLLASPSNFHVTVLSRASSSSTRASPFPPRVATVQVADDYPHAELVEAFRGVDVVVSAISMTGMHQQYKFIDAAVAARVTRYFPTEFGLDDLPDWLLQVREMFRLKHDVRDYCVAKQREAGLEWTAIVCNAFFDMGVLSGFFELHWKEKTAVLVDGGHARFVATTLDTAALAVVRAIERADESRNRLLLVQDFRVSQREILDAVEARTGPWRVQDVPYEAWLQAAKDKVQGGDNSALSKLTFATFARGNSWEGRGELGNGVLDLPTKTFQEAMEMVWREKAATES